MATTVNTAILKLVDEKKKLRTTVKVESRLRDGSTAIILTKEDAITLAHQIITLAAVSDEDRINLTIMKDSPSSMSLTNY